jgi:hypothetical protein
MLAGTHLAASAQRIEALRRTWAAPVPGQILVVWAQEPMRAIAVVLGEDGPAQDRAWLGQVRSLGDQDDLWIAERNCCTVDVLCGIAARGGSLVIRQHGQLKGTLVGARQRRGARDSGTVYAHWCQDTFSKVASNLSFT